MDGHSLPNLKTSLPGPASRALVDRLARVECPAITSRRARRAEALGVADTDPIVWSSARGANVLDVDGNVLVDLTAGFGVASVGHAHPAVVAAGQAQLGVLPHAMGDAFPDPRRIELLERLAELTGLSHTILGSSGSDAVEAALKTARMATGRDGVLAFEGAYHGLSYGALAVTGYKTGAFQAPFAAQLGAHVRRAEFGGELPSLDGIGAVIVEPIQGRGGVRVPPPGWLAGVRAACDQAGAVLILDEIYTGFGRTGSLFAFQHEGVRPDLLCVGKGMAGGYPISACIGTREVMASWGASKGEALHTQTFLGNPVGSAMALACIDLVVNGELHARAEEYGDWARRRLARHGNLRGRGLLLGLELPDALGTSRALFERGWIALPAGEQGEVLCLTPPLTISGAQLEGFFDVLDEVLS
ncbi:MAG: aspartate aminotransferase family protein [Proteobacteria bacterium]|nr:aspartate aminotransferase family protein [Pseudomonadota bacterium]MCP4917885.1 aspartate aminotransferase family protein [Pseudomonadota bacterium]